MTHSFESRYWNILSQKKKMELAAGNAHIFNGRMFLWVVDEKCSFVSYFSRKRDSQKDDWNARKIYNSVIIKSLFLCIVVSTETSIFWEGKTLN